MIDWKRKLTSRKFWATLADFVGMLIVALGASENTAVQVTALILAGGGVIAYVIGEGLIDAAGAANNASVIGFANWKPEDFMKKEDETEDVETVQS